MNPRRAPAGGRSKTSNGSPGSFAATDTNLYLIVLRVARDRRIRVGALGLRRFRCGWYVYVGSAKRNLRHRVARHLRLRTRRRWHIDYLRTISMAPNAFVIRLAGATECGLAREVQNTGGDAVPGFGCSDCRCPAHLFFFTGLPSRIPAFVQLLNSYDVVVFGDLA
jgi:sugar fermentation stimulation protein A